jgi:hypothetical protein
MIGRRPTNLVALCSRRRGIHGLVLFSFMRYLVKGRVKPGKNSELLRAIDNGTLGKGSIAGDEYLYNMEQARVNDQGVATWVETCFCDPPLAEERPYWDEYFQLLNVKDAHSRRSCRHENGTEPWPAAIAIAQRNSRSGSPRKAIRFWKS